MARPPLLLLRAAATAIPIAWAVAAHAGATCTVRFEDGAEGSPSWRHAAEGVERAAASAPSDCASIDIQVDARGAHVQLRTLDGRVAERRAETPRELGPLVRAMLIGFEADTPPPVDVDTSVPPPHPPAADPAPPPDVVLPSRSAREHPELFAAVSAGLEVQPNDGAAGVGEAVLGISLNAWQLGAFGKWQGEHHPDAGPISRHTTLAAAGGGAVFGRRQRIGPVFFVYGSSFGLYDVSQERGGRRDGLVHVEDDILDARAGLYLGAVVPTTGRFRTRIQLDGEVALAGHDTSSVFSEIPRWGIGLTAGVDFGFWP